MRRELRAAGITDPRLCADYVRCRELHARYGRTYYLATLALPPQRRPAVHALYGFARWVDDVVDDLDDTVPVEERTAVLTRLDAELTTALSGGESTEPVVRAVADTAWRYGIGAELFAAFLRSMRMDLSVTDYPTFDDLRGYMYGSAAVIGLQVLPVLGTVVPLPRAAPHAAALGEAFQLTNFLRDVAEDLDRGRVYLPADVLAHHGVDRELLAWCRARRRGDPRVRDALAHMVAVNRDGYRMAEPGIAMLDPVSRPCVATAFTLYRGIVDAIEAADFDVWSRRRSVPRRRRVRVAVPAFAQAVLLRVGGRRRTDSGTAPRAGGARISGRD
ncbi:phytoene/squalene synthase family protein [Thermobifida halotolerans]|uniref:Phytoene/squalene synthase family protein n=1 Tax=Thermobifida halotolerans TaxID=483545 RepID=A0A399FZ10_9ACTN|nr:phytoene/squalene synthase family protein [Thermobifida halotolerans]UOE18942.1 phytoene/squalene synthase family protein [Thermobifida halotolerans]